MRKTNSLKKIATMLMAVVMAFATLSTTALAAESDFLNNEIICEEVDSQRSSSATVRFEVESWENPKQYGRFVATSDSISIRFSQCVEGSALVEFHRGSYNGSVDASIIMPSPNNLPTTVTTNRNVQSGATYYITVSTYSDFIKATGGFTITY